MKLSNLLLGILNVITALISLPIIGFGVWLVVKHHTECGKLVQWPVIGVGVFVLVVSLAGLGGSFGRVRWLLGVYLAVVLVLIVAVLGFTIFAFVVTNKGAGHAVSGKGFKEYKLGDYSSWLQRNVVEKPKTWRKIQSCLLDAKVCKSLQEDAATVKTVKAFNKLALSPIESGCCKPPTACNFQFVTPTQWKNNATIAKMNADTDCAKWSNDTSQLCFNCDSCRAGVLQDAKKNWKKLAIVNVAVLVLLILIFSLGCCACANSRRQRPSSPGGFYVKA